MCRFTVVVTDRPGGMAEMLAIIAENGGSIKEVFNSNDPYSNIRLYLEL